MYTYMKYVHICICICTNMYICIHMNEACGEKTTLEVTKDIARETITSHNLGWMGNEVACFTHQPFQGVASVKTKEF